MFIRPIAKTEFSRDFVAEYVFFDPSDDDGALCFLIGA